MSGADDVWGRARERLAERLREIGFEAHTIRCVQGAPRNGRVRLAGEHDTFRWEAFGTWGGLPNTIGSYDTVTKCARYGIELMGDGECCAKEPQS